MNDFYITTIPVLRRLGTAFQWMMLLNIILIGVVILLANWASSLREKVNELQAQLEAKDHPPAEGLKSDPLNDDKPIPLARHRFGDASGLIKDDNPQP